MLGDRQLQGSFTLFHVCRAQDAELRPLFGSRKRPSAARSVFHMLRRMGQLLPIGSNGQSSANQGGQQFAEAPLSNKSKHFLQCLIGCEMIRQFINMLRNVNSFILREKEVELDKVLH